jgi:arsenate reductase|tara:strand:- start:27529 stop:27900 length:372 start_codon:yes stop_codon:yes gene_type:complete
MIFANTDKEITLIYHSKDRTGQQILAYAQSENIPIHDIDLKYVKLTKTHWAELASRMNIHVWDLVNKDHSAFLQKFGHTDNLSEDDWLTLLVHNPDILIAPIVMKGDKVVAMRNPQDMLQFIK